MPEDIKVDWTTLDNSKIIYFVGDSQEEALNNISFDDEKTARQYAMEENYSKVYAADATLIVNTSTIEEISYE